MTAERREGIGGRLASLHEGTADLISATDRDDLYQRVVDIAEDVLAFDQSVLLERDGDQFTARAASPPISPELVAALPTESSLTARSVRTGESLLVGDASEYPEAFTAGHDFRSAVMVPLGDGTIFQALSTEENTFDETDLELAELLCAHATETLARIEAETEFRDQHDRLEALFENVPDAAVRYEFVDREPIIRRVNPTFERVFDLDAAEVVGESLDELIVPPGGWSGASGINDRLAAGENLRTEVERVTGDGPRDFLLHVVPLELDTENVGGFAIYTDITEQRHREQALERQNERLDEFASVVSHDLRNPLNVAQGYLDLARETGDDHHLDRVADAHDRMDELVSELLSLAREGRDVADVEPVDLGTVIERAWNNVDTVGLTLEPTADTDIRIDADRDRLCELFENLFRNAAEHAGPGATVTVGPMRTRAREGGQIGGFYVADDGPGLETGVDIFEAGVTTNSDGTGIGLSIVRQIAEAHGWQVEAVNEGEGARFEFAF